MLKWIKSLGVDVKSRKADHSLATCLAKFIPSFPQQMVVMLRVNAYRSFGFAGSKTQPCMAGENFYRGVSKPHCNRLTRKYPGVIMRLIWPL